MLVSSGDVILCALSLKSYILKRIYISILFNYRPPRNLHLGVELHVVSYYAAQFHRILSMKGSLG